MNGLHVLRVCSIRRMRFSRVATAFHAFFMNFERVLQMQDCACMPRVLSILRVFVASPKVPNKSFPGHTQRGFPAGASAPFQKVVSALKTRFLRSKLVTLVLLLTLVVRVVHTW